MPHRSVSTFTDADSYAAALRGGQYEMLGKSSGPFTGKMTRTDFPRVSLKRDEVDVPWIVHFGGSRGPGLCFGFLADVDGAPMQINGTDVTSHDLWVIGPGSTVFASGGPSRLRTMALPDAALVARNATDRKFEAPAVSFVMRPPASALDRLRALHRTAESLAKANAKELCKPSVVRALEEALVQALASCLTNDMSSTAQRHSERHRQVITRFRDYLASRSGEAVHLTEVCAAIGVSERTLRAYCQDTFGVGPIHYLWLRRMHLARRALSKADPASMTVTEVATDHGFWELGRFSVEYRSLFGELPSATLKQPPLVHCRETAGKSIGSVKAARISVRGLEPLSGQTRNSSAMGKAGLRLA